MKNFSYANSSVDPLLGPLKIQANDVILNSPIAKRNSVSFNEVANFVLDQKENQEKEKQERLIKEKLDLEEKMIGVVAVTLSGAGVFINKNPVISRRFWARSK